MFTLLQASKMMSKMHCRGECSCLADGAGGCVAWHDDAGGLGALWGGPLQDVLVADMVRPMGRGPAFSVQVL